MIRIQIALHGFFLHQGLVSRVVEFGTRPSLTIDGFYCVRTICALITMTNSIA